ncbi:MAG TPA: hypothetical protein VI504_07970 [Candidatus Eisenbacteria bacterium]|jgi:predicted 2-oxoglutarate/Fe(II)-dependent dioxygenase YbiX
MSPRRNDISGKHVVKLEHAKIIPLPSEGVVRLARVAQARRRIASGWYDRAEVRDSLVEAVLHEFRGR